MASVAYASYDNHQTLHGADHYMMKRTHVSSRVFSLDHYPANSYGLETVGESDTRSQKTELSHGQSYVPSETASGDSCSMRRNKTNAISTPMNACNSAAAYFSSRSSRASRSERNSLRKQLKMELSQVQSMISRLEARELDLRSFLHMPELDNNGSSSKSICEPMQTQEDYSEIKGLPLLFIFLSCQSLVVLCN